MAKILIIDDDTSFTSGLAETVKDFGHEPAIAASGERGLVWLERCAADLIFLDLRMPGMQGLAVLSSLKAHPERKEVPVIVLTAYADSANTIEAMKLGAFDHLTKPVGREDVKAVLERALVQPAKMAGIPRAASGTEEEFIGLSPGMREVQKRIGMAAASDDSTVLILGKTGTGKELVARAIHRHSSRAGKPFIAVNCAAIPAELLESELFGHTRGAFTGSVQATLGRFREAHGGTIFLDEVGDMSLPMQAKILRVLQDKTVTPLGGGESHKVSVRVIAATLRDLIGLVKEGKFREDLFYRLNGFSIALPPLRERGSDILVLAEHFLHRTTLASPKRLSATAAKALLEYPWPGNVRELENIMRKLNMEVRGAVIDVRDLGLGQPQLPPDSLEDLLSLDYSAAIARLEKLLLQRALDACEGNRAEAARRLGINRQLLYTKIREHGLGD